MQSLGVALDVLLPLWPGRLRRQVRVLRVLGLAGVLPVGQVAPDRRTGGQPEQEHLGFGHAARLPVVWRRHAAGSNVFSVLRARAATNDLTGSRPRRTNAQALGRKRTNRSRAAIGTLSRRERDAGTATLSMEPVTTRKEQNHECAPYENMSA
jgi:hypothetical protein